MIYFVVCITSFIVATLTLFSGFGLGTLLLPTFSFFFPIEVAVATTAVVHLVNNLFKFVLVGHAAEWRITLRFTIPAAITAALGAWILSKIGASPPLASYALFGREFQVELIKLVIGTLMVTFSLLECIPMFGRISIPPKFISLGGAISGFFGGLSGLQGALRSMFLIRAGLKKEQYIGTTVASAIMVDLSRIAVYGVAIFWQQFAEIKAQRAMGLMAAATIFALLGSLLGARLLKRVTLVNVQGIVATLLSVNGVALICGLV